MRWVGFITHNDNFKNYRQNVLWATIRENEWILFNTMIFQIIHVLSFIIIYSIFEYLLKTLFVWFVFALIEVDILFAFNWSLCKRKRGINVSPIITTMGVFYITKICMYAISNYLILISTKLAPNMITKPN